MSFEKKRKIAEFLITHLSQLRAGKSLNFRKKVNYISRATISWAKVVKLV